MKGYSRVRASLAEKKLFLPGFKVALCRHLTSLNGASEGSTDVMIEFQDPIISTFNSIRISYPTGIEDEIISRRELMGQEPNGSQEPNGRPSQLLRQTTSSLAKSMVTERIKAQPIGTQYGRRDAVLVECPGKESRGQVNTMSQRRVAQVLLLFTCPYWQERLELAFVSWFETKRTADPNSGLYLVGRTTKYTVISVKDIERPVHLIPKFGSQVGTTTKVKRELGHTWQIFEN